MRFELNFVLAHPAPHSAFGIGVPPGLPGLRRSAGKKVVSDAAVATLPNVIPAKAGTQ
jgi:hypothetical protein